MHNEKITDDILGERYEKSPLRFPSESPFFDSTDFEFVYIPKKKKKDMSNDHEANHYT